MCRIAGKPAKQTNKGVRGEGMRVGVKLFVRGGVGVICCFFYIQKKLSSSLLSLPTSRAQNPTPAFMEKRKKRKKKTQISTPPRFLRLRPQLGLLHAPTSHDGVDLQQHREARRRRAREGVGVGVTNYRRCAGNEA